MSQARLFILLAIAAIFFITISLLVGPSEAAVLTGGIAILTATTYMPSHVTRWLGAAYLALVIFVFARAAFGDAAAGILVALVLAGLAFIYVPPRVHRRVCFMIPSMVLLIFVTAMLMYEAPGSPFASEKSSTQQALQAQAKRFKVEPTATAFFFTKMEEMIGEGTLGLSVKNQGRTVEELLGPALPVSMSLGLLALLLALGIGLFMGIRAGLRPNTAADYTSMAVALVGITLPNFVIGAYFMILFSLSLGWLPVAGWGSYVHLILPALTLALPFAAYIARLARNGTIEVMQQDFIRTARAKGVPERTIVMRHAFKGAILPVVSFLGPAAAGVFTGSFVIETLFGIPGMGQFFVKGAINRDYSVVLGTAVIYFAIITLFNLIVDMAYAWLDPRVREEL